MATESASNHQPKVKNAKRVRIFRRLGADEPRRGLLALGFLLMAIIA